MPDNDTHVQTSLTAASSQSQSDQQASQSGSEDTTPHSQDVADSAQKATQTSPEQTDSLSQAATQVTSQSGNDERATPQEFIQTLCTGLQTDRFDLDPCSGAEPTHRPIGVTRFTKQDDGLSKRWADYSTIFVNPPYSDISSWVKKVCDEHNRQDPPQLTTVLLPANTSTQWFHNYATEAEYLVLIEGRLSFGTTGSAPFASILCVFGNPDDTFLSVLPTLGTVYSRAEIQAASTQARLDTLLQTDGGGVLTSPQASHSRPRTPALTMLDLSSHAPAVPQNVIPFPDIGYADSFTVEITETIPGVPGTLNSPIDCHVIAGESASVRTHGTHNPSTPPDWQTLTLASDTQELLLTLSQSPASPTHVCASVSLRGQPWQSLPIHRIIRHSAHSTPALNPYGPGTTRIC